jgi:translation initiation factor 2B subunit (eIF-2B alpha/beta/delta family)
MEIPEINKRIEEIANDKTSGASYIAKKAAECIDDFAKWVLDNKSGLSIEEYLEELTKIAINVIRSQPTMASVFRAVNEIIVLTINQTSQLETELGHDKIKQLTYLCTSTQAAARKYILESELALETIARAYAEVLHDGDTIMTISASSAVEALLLQANASSLDVTVYIPESRPMYEGRMMVERLAERGIKTILIADSAMFHFLKECSSILVGADRVMPEGIINKIGTHGVAIAAKEFKIPFYCTCERTKFIPNLIPIDKIILAQPEDQIYEPINEQKKPKNLSIKNIYFDFTPIEYVTYILTEDGVLTNKQVNDYIKNLEILPELISGLTLV